MSLRFLTAGESHGPALLVILEGMPAGITIDPAKINFELTRRQKGYGAGPRMKIETDQVDILGGVMGGVSIGSPIAMLITNNDYAKWRGKSIPPMVIPRPGHADLTASIKYGYKDLRPALERASARETAARVAAGAVCKIFLQKFGITVGGYVTSIGEIEANLVGLDYMERITAAEMSDVRCPDPQAAQEIHARIRQVIDQRDTLGGVIEIIALGLPVGLGSHVHWDRRLESRLGAALLSVQAIKGVEIGPAFENSRKTGLQAQDPILLKDGVIHRPSSRSGGIEGGITNGAPLIVRAAMKPIATTLSPQTSVNLATGVQTETQYERSDFCPVPRAVPILEAMTAFILADVLLEKLGGDSLDEILPRFNMLKQTRLEDIPMDGSPHLFWPSD